MENEKLDITPTVGLLALLKNMRYTEWYALGEFVDNSIQSYRLNKKFLRKLDPLFKLKIKIWFNDYYRLLSNTYYKTSYGTTQIDHILISPKGIFVIEVKNLGESFISGYEKQKVWTIEYTATGAEFEIKNPLHQNYGHLKTIEGIVGDSSNIKSLVIFSNAVEFDNKMPKNVINEVGYPIILDSVSNMSFGALLFSSFIPVQYVGGLMVFAMFSTSFGTLTLLASIVYLLKKNKLIGSKIS